MDEELIPTQPQPALDVPQEMILAMAIGMEEPEEIASRYGFDGIRWKSLQAWKPFNDAVAKQKAELEQRQKMFESSSLPPSSSGISWSAWPSLP